MMLRDIPRARNKHGSYEAWYEACSLPVKKPKKTALGHGLIH